MASRFENSGLRCAVALSRLCERHRGRHTLSDLAPLRRLSLPINAVGLTPIGFAARSLLQNRLELGQNPDGVTTPSKAMPVGDCSDLW